MNPLRPCDRNLVGCKVAYACLLRNLLARARREFPRLRGWVAEDAASAAVSETLSRVPKLSACARALAYAWRAASHDLGRKARRPRESLLRLDPTDPEWELLLEEIEASDLVEVFLAELGPDDRRIFSALVDGKSLEILRDEVRVSTKILRRRAGKLKRRFRAFFDAQSEGRRRP